MATNGVLRSAGQILKFLADGHGFDRVLKNVNYQLSLSVFVCVCVYMGGGGGGGGGDHSAHHV